MEHLIKKESMFYACFVPVEDLKDYRDSYKEIIKQREKIRIPFLHSSLLFNYRVEILKHLKQICFKRKFSYCTLHLAVYLMDVFMDNHKVEVEKLFLLANTCLLLSAKFEENMNDIPKIPELNAYNTEIENRYTNAEYKNCEQIVLEYFNWYIRYPTSAHYVFYYLQAAISQDDDDIRNNGENVRTLLHKIRGFVIEYLDEIINNIHYMQDFKPSELAATIIAASRAMCDLNFWTNQLQQFTGYTKFDLQAPLYTLQINRYKQIISPLLIDSNLYLCTFKKNYCTSCNIISCPQCFFLKKF